MVDLMPLSPDAVAVPLEPTLDTAFVGDDILTLQTIDEDMPSVKNTEEAAPTKEITGISAVEPAEPMSTEEPPIVKNEPLVTNQVVEQAIVEPGSAPTVKRPEWIPFIYYYRQSMTQYGPCKTLYVMPIAPHHPQPVQVRWYPVVMLRFVPMMPVVWFYQ